MMTRRRSSSSYSSGSRSADRIMTRAHSAHRRCVALAPCCPHAPPSPLAHQVTLQELSNLERFVKRNGNDNAGPGPPATERLLKEEAYLKSRLVFVQQVGSGLGSGLGLGLGRGLGLGLGLGRDWDWLRMPRARVLAV